MYDFCIAVVTLSTLAALGAPVAPALPRCGEADDLIRSARSGPWSSVNTWELGRIPGAGSRVQIRTGHTVTYDIQSDEPIRSIHVAGVLTFAPDRDTRLSVGLIKIQPGDDASENGFDCDAHLPELEPGQSRPWLAIGSPDHPIDAPGSALVRLVYVEGMDKQSCPAIVCCGGRMDFHGAAMSRTWVKLGDAARKGDTTVQVAEMPTGWRIGDRVIVTAANQNYSYDKESHTEERTILAIDADRVTLDRALAFDHLGQGDYRGELANLSRNVVVESANPDVARGHTMYHRGSAGSISYAEFRHLGKEGALGRYSLHFHLVGDSMRGSSVVGASIWDSANRWLTIHGTNYLVVRDCVGYRSIGHGFFLEDGTEVYNVLDRNLAVQARRGKKLPRQVLPFDQNEGAGFWWANSRNSFTRNVAADNDLYGFRYEATPTSALDLTMPVLQPDGTRQKVDIRTLPFIRFDSNEVHSSAGLYGFNLGEGVARVGPDPRHPFIVRGMKIWDVHYAFRPQVPALLVEDMEIYRAAYGVYHPNFDYHVYRNMHISETETEPFNRGHDDDSIQFGVLAVDGLVFDGIRSGEHMPLIQISDNNPTGIAESHFRNVQTTHWSGSPRRALVNLGGGPRPTPQTERGVPIYLHDWFGPGRHAKVMSTKSHEIHSDGIEYREVPLLTGDESRAAEISQVDFPSLLDPVDDLPPVTVITSVRRLLDGTLAVHGTTSDNGSVVEVRVNDQRVRALSENYSEWELIMRPGEPSSCKLTAHAVDAAGNIELQPHEIVISE